jgi:hypothetical protein
MTTIVSQTAFPVQGLEQRFYSGALYHCVSVKLTLRWRADGALSPLLRQPDFVLNDRWREAPYRSPLDYPSELAPFKPTTDVLVIGTARPRDGVPVRHWDALLQLPGVSKRLRLCGPRLWRHSLAHGWRLSEPEPTDGVHLGYDQAFGGVTGEPRDHYVEGEFHPANPHGCGYLGRRGADPSHDYRAPQIEAWNGAIADLGDDVAVGGFGPLPGFVPQRARYAGTRDAHWAREIAPALPADMDLRYWNCAPEDQQPADYLCGGDRLELLGLTREGHVSLQIPTTRAFLVRDYDNGDTAALPLQLDTAIVDLDQRHLSLRYHQIVPLDDAVDRIRVYCALTSPSARS